MLQALAKLGPQPNITSHLASWTQHGKCYMLLPRAERNLHRFLRDEVRGPTPHAEEVVWLLNQLKGLAEGVRTIHILGPMSALSAEDQPSSKGRKSSGFHHDLKPENILVFKDENTPRGVLKISDFGSARIGRQRSGNPYQSYFTSNISHGDAVYGAPDFLIQGKTSRPYDVWSLGCIFLEILLWFFDVSGANLDEFCNERSETPNATGNIDPAFWYLDNVDNEDGIRIKPAVIKRLVALRTYCKGKGVFEDVVRSTAQMLTIKPDERPKIEKICLDLDAVIIQATKFDLLESPDFYMLDRRDRLVVAAPPSTTGGSLDRRPSIDNGLVMAPNAKYLRPDLSISRRASRSDLRQEDDAEGPMMGQIIQLAPDEKRLSPLMTQNIGGGFRTRSPSITVSSPEESPSAESERGHARSQSDGDPILSPGPQRFPSARQAILYSADQAPIGREDIEINWRVRSG